MFTGIWTWSDTWSNPVKPEGKSFRIIDRTVLFSFTIMQPSNDKHMRLSLWHHCDIIVTLWKSSHSVTYSIKIKIVVGIAKKCVSFFYKKKLFNSLFMIPPKRLFRLSIISYDFLFFSTETGKLVKTAKGYFRAKI